MNPFHQTSTITREIKIPYPSTTPNIRDKKLKDGYTYEFVEEILRKQKIIFDYLGQIEKLEIPEEIEVKLEEMFKFLENNPEIHPTCNKLLLDKFLNTIDLISKVRGEETENINFSYWRTFITDIIESNQKEELLLKLKQLEIKKEETKRNGNGNENGNETKGISFRKID